MTTRASFMDVEYKKCHEFGQQNILQDVRNAHTCLYVVLTQLEIIQPKVMNMVFDLVRHCAKRI